MSFSSWDYAEALSPNRSLLCDRIKAEPFVPVRPYPPQSRITEACETDTFSCRAGGGVGWQTQSSLQGHVGCGGGGGVVGVVPLFPSLGDKLHTSGLYLNSSCMQKNCVWAPVVRLSLTTGTSNIWESERSFLW